MEPADRVDEWLEDQSHGALLREAAGRDLLKHHEEVPSGSKAAGAERGRVEEKRACTPRGRGSGAASLADKVVGIVVLVHGKQSEDAAVCNAKVYLGLPDDLPTRMGVPSGSMPARVSAPPLHSPASSGHPRACASDRT